jgi:hypothetical protein
LSADYLRVGEARHEELKPYDFDIRTSSIRSPGGSWLPARIRGDIGAEAESMHLARLARDTVGAAAWKVEFAKPMQERRYIRCGDIADALARAPESLEVDAVVRDRIVRDLGDWTIRGEFDLSGESEVVVLSLGPPHFLPLGTVPPGAIVADPERLILRRGACRRYLQNSLLQRAPRLLRDWFPEMAVGLQSPGEDATSPKTAPLNNGVVIGAQFSGHVMPPDEAEQYIMLWDVAAELARANGRSVERCRLNLMNAFWRGDLAASGLTYFYPVPPAGREFIIIDHDGFAGMLLGHRNLDTGAKSINDLRNWSVADYRNQPAPFGDFFQCDPEGRVGLAILTRELTRWHRDAENPAKPVSPNAVSPKGEEPPNDRPTVNPTLRVAIEDALKTYGTPGKTVPWKTLYAGVRLICEVGPNVRGYGDKSIERAVKAIYAEQDKNDKSDMSEMS